MAVKVRRKHRYDPEAMIAAGKWSDEQKAKIKKVLKEFKAGTLESSDGRRVTNKRQALAIALSMAREMTAAAPWDESQHPRHPRGSKGGGRFRSKAEGRAAAEKVIEETRAGFGDEGVREMVDEELSESGRARGREMSEQPEEYHEGWEERLREEQQNIVDMEEMSPEAEAIEGHFADLGPGWEPVDAEPGEWMMVRNIETGQELTITPEGPEEEEDEDLFARLEYASGPVSELSDEELFRQIQRAEASPATTSFQERLLDLQREANRRIRKQHGGTTASALTAAAAGLAPVKPPREWFDKPDLGEPTPLTVTADGQVFGHAALWSTCHTGMPGVCRTPPRSQSDYRFFHLGEVETASGEPVHVGRITMDTGHAPLTASKDTTVRHYDDTGFGAAHVRAYEDEHGIVLAGALMPDIPAEKARRLKGAAVSGDWRSINGKLELVGMLAVNVPGFPVPRAMAASLIVEDEPHTMALVAAGMYCDPDDYDRKMKALSARALGGLDGLAAAALGGTPEQRRMAASAAVVRDPAPSV